MKINDFSIPRRMSKSAFVIFFVKALRSYASLILILFTVRIFDSSDETSIMEYIIMLLSYLAAFIAISLITAFLGFYFKKYYVEDGNLIFIHGVIQHERTSIPLNKIQSLRTKSGLIYRMLDMKGVSFDTLASRTEEIELILDDDDWDALLSRVENKENTQEEVKETEATEQETTENNKTIKLEVSNLNLIKGALCQNHLKGMAVLFGVLATLYNQITSVNDKAANYFIDYVETHADSSAFSVTAVLTVIVILYLVILILWMGKVFLQYFNMDIRMGEKQLFFESGLITRNSSRFSFDKVCTLYVKRNIIENWLGCCTIMVRQALNATDEKKGADVKIYGSSHDGNFLSWWFGKDYTSSPTVISARSGYGLLGYTIRFDILISLAVAIVLCHYGQYIWLFAPIAYMLVSLAKGFLAVRRSHITLKEDYMEISNGKFAEIYNYVKYDNIEVVRMVSTPFTPYYHRVKLVISTNGTSFAIRSLKEHEAKEIYELLLLNCHNN